MQLIAADIGNSSTKVAVNNVSDDKRWCMQSVFRGDEPIAFDADASGMSQQPAFWSVSSVNKQRESKLKQWVEKHRPNDQFHTLAESDIPLESDVESRTQLGRDRLLAAWTAVELNDRSGPVVVVDAGTAVTIDLVSSDLVFQGGHIFPGAESNFRFLAQSTDALPDLSSNKRTNQFGDLAFGAVGKSTNEAILQGVYQSQIGAVIGIVNAMSRRHKIEPVVYSTGGGIADISDALPNEWIHVPDLVLIGAKMIGQQLVDDK